MTVRFLREVLGPHTDDTVALARAEAYSCVHACRIAVTSALSDPPPLADLAAGALPAALALEDAVDGITTLDAELHGGARRPDEQQVAALEKSIMDCGQVAAAQRQVPVRLIREVLSGRESAGDSTGQPCAGEGRC